MNPHAPVTLASSEALGEHPVLLKGLFLDWVGGWGGDVEEVGAKVKGGVTGSKAARVQPAEVIWA